MNLLMDFNGGENYSFAYLQKKAVPILQDDVEKVAEQEDGECNAAEEGTNQFPTHHFFEHGGFGKR